MLQHTKIGEGYTKQNYGGHDVLLLKLKGMATIKLRVILYEDRQFQTKKEVTFSEFNEILHTCWAMGEAEISQILDLCDLWSSSCKVIKFCHLKVVQILKIAVIFLFLKIFTWFQSY